MRSGSSYVTGTELFCSPAPRGLSWFNPGWLLLRIMLCLKHKVLWASLKAFGSWGLSSRSNGVPFQWHTGVPLHGGILTKHIPELSVQYTGHSYFLFGHWLKWEQCTFMLSYKVGITSSWVVSFIWLAVLSVFVQPDYWAFAKIKLSSGHTLIMATSFLHPQQMQMYLILDSLMQSSAATPFSVVPFFCPLEPIQLALTCKPLLTHYSLCLVSFIYYWMPAMTITLSVF